MSLLTKNRINKKIALVMAALLFFQVAFPSVAMALTSGPTQPEFSEFEPVGTSQMVDLFSGDFVHNIPLFELPGPDGGYPFNLSYHSGITMDQEATWVGLGWSLNSGAINRTMRGIPDDFDGDVITRDMDMKPNKTWKFGLTGMSEFWGYEPATELMITETEIIPGQPGTEGNLSLNLGISMTHNNYKGWGAGFSTGLNTNFNSGSSFAFNGGLGLDVNTFDGASLKPSLSFGFNKKKLGSLMLSSSINSRQGITTFGLGYSNGQIIEDDKNKNGIRESWEPSTTRSISGTSTYSFGGVAYSPQVDMPYSGFNLSGSVEVGGDLWGVGIGGTAEVSFNKQKLKENFRSSPAFGYFNMKNRDDLNNEMGLNMPNALLDFNREKDGAIRKNTPNLANPITTPDIYSVMGQGIGGVYKPYRSDVGILTDPGSTSKTGGGNLGVEVNPGSGFALGVTPGGNWAIDRSTNWGVESNGLANYKYQTSSSLDPVYEEWYFKAAGEMTAEPANANNYIGGERAARIKLDSKDDDVPKLLTPNSKRHQYSGSAMLEFADGTNQSINSTTKTRSDRKPRANAIQPITNEQLLDNGVEKLTEYQVDILPNNNNSTNIYSTDVEEYDRSNNNSSHLAGITALQPNGLRYVYGLPAMNKTQKEYSFSIPAGQGECGPTVDIPTVGNELNYKHPNTNEYKNITTVPEYAHSYLLTSIIGADYVDVTGDGITNDDIGYWVKFHYKKTADNYQWKAPFWGANHLKGTQTNTNDDQGSFMYGEREQYYLSVAETKTHIAEFNTSVRADGRDASGPFQNSGVGNNTSHKLDNIQLFSKLERYLNNTVNSNAQPIQTIHMQYDNSLCNNVHNSLNANSGKLTLKKLWFTSENSNRGALSPYEFSYDNLNPHYDNNKYDRWGNYKPLASGQDECDNQNFPYSEQYLDKSIIDERVSAWHLSSIKLPSGATIDIDYESDDYAYVQDRTAMQMFNITSVGDANGSTLSVDKNGNLSDVELQVTFNLENGNQDAILNYIEDLHGATFTNGNYDEGSAQMYYKISSDLNNSNGGFEFVEGYAKIKSISTTGSQGEIILMPQEIDNGNSYHPFCASAWQKLKMEFPDKLNGDGMGDNDEISAGEAIGKLGSVFGEIKQIFQSYYQHCADESFGTQLDLSDSFIRLNTPDKIKYGGGVRVKQITLNDNWDVGEDGESDAPTYGQVYEYTTEDKNGDIISSGVAVNEPTIGGEESALRYAKEWVNDIFLKTDENLLHEYPINESYYPGASVGYNKVTVKSLATHYTFLNPETDPDYPTNLGINNYATTGVTVNEFYTAKDFPVLVEETENDGRANNLWIPLGLASYRGDFYTGSQGYAITLNDMHGKQKKVTHYGQDKNGDLVMEQKLNEVVYNYKTKDVVTQSASNKSVAQELDNLVEVLVSDDQSNPDAITESQLMGVDIEFFTDMRETKSDAGNAHVGLGVNFEWPFIFAITAWPNLNWSESRTRLAVTNKVIRKSGILESVNAFDGQANLVTTNEVFDPMTGQALLTSVNNNFDNKVYNYNLPARYVYDGMGEAYKNWGLTVPNVTLNFNAGCLAFETVGINLNIGNELVPGDEFILMNCSGSDLCDDKLAYIGKVGNQYRFQPNVEIPSNNSNANIQADLLLIRSGRRNHLQASAGSIVALNDPTINRTSETSIASIAVPTSGGGVNYQPKNISVKKLSNVLSTGAITFTEGWDLENGACDVQGTVLEPLPNGGGQGFLDNSSNESYIVNNDLQPKGGDESLISFYPKSDYFLGRKGVWRPDRSYTYVTDRTSTDKNSVTRPDLEDEGVMNDITLFNWENPFFDQCVAAQDWKWTSEITKYTSNGEEVENRDVLGIYSGALYGYNDNLSIAVGANARFHEIGFNGFEEYEPTNLSASPPPVIVNNVSGNIDFKCHTVGSLVSTETFNIIGGFDVSQGAVWIDKSYTTDESNISKVTLFLKDEFNREFVLESDDASFGNIINASSTNLNLPGHFKLTPLNLGSGLVGCPAPNSITTGKVVITYCSSFETPTNCASLNITEKGHTGKHSLRVPSGAFIFDQKTMKLEQGESYVISGWVSRDNVPNQPTYQNVALKVNNQSFAPEGEIIDGWQKIEGEFTYDGNTWSISLDAGTDVAYFDDIRIHPKDGNIQTYVYDPADYRLRAVLDQNNYATFYHYDEEGVLFLVKKETERGIKTIQETRQYIKSTE